MDGRSVRWESHRRVRRAALADATLVAIRRHGPSVGMDDVARVAGTSKTVLYRHFTDKVQLYLAVCERVADTLLRQLRQVLGPERDIREAGQARAALAAGIDVYLQLIESDPKVYRFVVHHPALDRPIDADPVDGLVQLIGDQVARVIAPTLRSEGVDPEVALPWGHGVIGLVKAAADPWLDGRVALTRLELTDYLTQLAWNGLSGAVASSSEGS